MFRSIASALLLAALTLVGIGSVSAQTGPGKMPGGSPFNSSPAPVTAGVSEADLAAYVRSLDANVQVSQNQIGTTIYKFAIRRNDGWSYTTQVESSKGGMWLVVSLGKLPVDAEKLNPTILAGLLQANFKYGPNHFSIEKGTNGSFLTMARQLDRTVSLERVKAEIERLLGQVKETYPIWGDAFKSGR